MYKQRETNTCLYSHYNVISMVMETNNFAGIFQMDPPPNKVMAAVIPLYHFSGTDTYCLLHIQKQALVTCHL